MFKFNELLDIDNKVKVNKIEKISKKMINDRRPWVDKYRPKKIDDIIYQYEVVKMLKDSLLNGNLPHLLFYGPPGTGKTSSILAIAMELYGPKIFKERVIELNASDERGINVVRTKIITLAKVAIGNNDPNYKSPPYKIIILDEADAMTREAQSALRKTMEDNSNITRFCFICNYINQIIEPIASRCVKFRFKPLNEKCMYDKLKMITQEEDMDITDPTLSAIINIAQGDMRKGIMLLQNLKYLYNFKKNKKDIIRPIDVYNMAGCVSDSILSKIDNYCISNKSLNVAKLTEISRKIINMGFPIHNILRRIQLLVIKNNIMNDRMKSVISLHFATTEKRLLDGADEYLQLLSILMCIKSVILAMSTVHKH